MSPPQKRLLFVDDEPNVLEGLQRMLFPYRKEWEMAFAPGGRQSLDLMARKPFDVIVSDMRMPGMDGAELLAEVMRRYPDTVRFVLSGQSDRETIFRSVGAAHQFLAKPCNAKTLKKTLDSAFALRDLLGIQPLKHLVAQVGALPALPEAYTRLMKELRSPDASIGAIGKIVESDVGMSARILQLVNSAFFGLRQHVSAVSHAVSLLGLDTIKALVLVAGIFQQADAKRLPASFSFDALVHHSSAVGTFAQAVIKAEGKGEGVSSEALTSGLLHDSGTLLLAANWQGEYKKALALALERRIPLWEAEREVMGCTHAEIGAYLLGIWGLPDPIVEAVAFHHVPSACIGDTLSSLTAVHVGNVIEHETHEAGSDIVPPKLDEVYLGNLGLTDRVARWREICSNMRTAGDGQ